MKKILFFSCIAAALLSFVGCEETGNDYEGTNYIYLESEGGKTTLLGTADDPITVNVKLTKALSEDLVLDFVIDGQQDILTVTNNPVTIKAGEKSASFTIGLADVDNIPEISSFVVSLDESIELPKNVELKSDFKFSAIVIELPDLTEGQNRILASYMAATDINLAKYIGEVNVSVEYTGYDVENEVLMDPVTITGKTIITLSDTATEELPVLKMLNNPMGIQDKMYETLRSLTVESSDWCDEEYYPDNVNLMNAIDWNAESQETFLMSLDGIKLNLDKTIQFVGEGEDQYGDPIVIVPFAYSFTAYSREMVAVANGTFEKQDEYAFDCTANPYYHLNNSDISEDAFEEGGYVEAFAEITADKMEFTFCMATAVDSDYTKVVATYTPNN